MITAYATAAESDAYLSAATYADWLVLTDAIKDDHLSWGRVYIDEDFTCPYTELTATDDMKHANSLLGYMSFKDTLFADNGPNISSVSVAAGSVSSSKTYSAGYRPTDALLIKAKSLLGLDCTTTFVTGANALARN